MFRNGENKKKLKDYIFCKLEFLKQNNVSGVINDFLIY